MKKQKEKVDNPNKYVYIYLHTTVKRGIDEPA
jgi:hypothetical protein